MASRSKVRQILIDQLLLDESEVTDDALIGDDLNADSLDVVELTMELEEQFDIEIDDTEVEEIRTFKDLFEFVDRKTAAKA